MAVSSGADNFQRWKDWWKRKRDNHWSRLPPVRPARDLVKAQCTICNARTIVFKDDPCPMCLKCLQKMIRTHLE